MKTILVKAFVLIAMLGLSGCDKLAAPVEEDLALFLPYAVNRVAVDPPPAQYKTWFHFIEQCTGLSYDFDAIKWYQVDSFEGIDAAGITKLAPTRAAIYLRKDYVALGLNNLTFERLVKHEALHVLLRGDPTHASPQWNKAECGYI